MSFEINGQIIIRFPEQATINIEGFKIIDDVGAGIGAHIDVIIKTISRSIINMQSPGHILTDTTTGIMGGAISFPGGDSAWIGMGDKDIDSLITMDTWLWVDSGAQSADAEVALISKGWNYEMFYRDSTHGFPAQWTKR